MLLPSLLVSDLHLTANPADAYKWSLFPWLADVCVSHRVRTLLILGDLTDAKDYHPAQLTNQLVTALTDLKRSVDAKLEYKPGLQIVILRGNHDYLKDGHTYFEFLNVLDGVQFIVKPTESMLDNGKAAFFLPHTRNPHAEWSGFDLSHYELVFMHQTIKGAIASNGQAMDGEELPDLSAAGKVYSGDIHVPQVIGQIEYVGSPYHVHFGDAFKPRAVLLDRKGKPTDLHFETISRIALKVDSLRQLKRSSGLNPGDQVKVTMTLTEAEKHDWLRIRRDALAWLKGHEVVVHGIKLEVRKSDARLQRDRQERKAAQPEDVLYEFVTAHELGGDMYETGLECMK